MHNFSRYQHGVGTSVVLLCALFALPSIYAQEDTNVIAEGKHVSFHYILSADGAEIENSRSGKPLTYTYGGGEIIPALETGMAGLTPGDNKEISLTAADAYGERDPGALQEVPIDQIPEPARQVGAQLQAEGVKGPILVSEVREDVIVLDFNHPLAGKDLMFAVEVVSVEDAK